MSHYIHKLIAQGEHQTLDFKYQITDSKKIARTLVAFANTDGGTLLVGVKDNGKVAGVRSEEEYFMIEAASKMYTKPAVPFSVQKHLVETKIVLEFKVPKCAKLPYLAPTRNEQWRAFVRVGAQNFIASKIHVGAWKQIFSAKEQAQFRYTQPEQLLFSLLENNNLITFSQFVRKASISRYKAERIFVNLVSMNILEVVYTENQVYYKLREELLPKEPLE